MDPAILQTRPATGGRRDSAVLRQQHHGSHHSAIVGPHRGPCDRARTRQRTDPTMRHDARLHHRARGLALRLPDVDGTFRTKLRIPLGKRRIRKAARARLHLLQPHPHRRHHEPHDLRHGRHPPRAKLGQLPGARLRGHVHRRARHDVHHRLASRPGARLHHAIPLHPDARPIFAREAAVLRHPQFARRNEFDGRRKHRRQPCGQSVRTRTVRNRKIRRTQRGSGLQQPQIHAVA